ncbi:hypothetical protein TSUD_186920 [Trifolium subterraneum]|uniref:Radical SAM core domain-containing protein n=1 Tax=Trifolium subterraneum TaxID=3900 RepID=A0A2Z6PTD4_TRISU|nr:hypothetical protein TSUD_186920 [Trifolium subterraneum]
MKNWMSKMAISAVANSTFLLLPTIPLKTIIPFSLTKTSSFLLSLTTPSRRYLSASALPSISTDHDVNLSDFSGDGNGVAISRKSSKVLLKGMTYSELEKWVQSHGYRPGQAIMLWKRMYGNNIWAQHTDELEGLNKDFKKMLSENADFKALAVKEIHAASDGTRKILFTLDDGMVIETVVIPCDRGRTTVMGLKRHLTAAEIVEQAVFARRLFTSEAGSITNVVFMGMGEPLHNIDNVIKAADIMVHDQGLHFSPRKVTVSTSGLVPQLRRYLQESNCAIAVSLNATTDEVRNWIMPINRKYKLDLLLETLREELSFKHKYKVLFEYVMLEGINDRSLSWNNAKNLSINDPIL